MRISVKEAAKRMGVCEQYVRIGLQQGRLPIGSAVKMSEKRFTYHISSERLNQYLGVEPWSSSVQNADLCTTTTESCVPSAMQKTNEELGIEDPFWQETLTNMLTL